MKLIIMFIVLITFLCSIASATIVIEHPHIGNTYFVGEDDRYITLLHNSNATNPTYTQMITFLRKDKTDQNRYINGKYTCSEFARDVYNNAEKVGIRSAWVSLDFKNDYYGHACNAFKTTDKGLIYIDCTGNSDKKRATTDLDSKVNVVVGKPFIPIALFPPYYKYESMGIVKHVDIFW